MKRVILVGPGGSGKDYLKSALEAKGFKCSVSYTTRAPREGEVEGVNYYYIDEALFLSMINNNEFREWNKFADKWYYGTSNAHFNAANLFIMTPSGIDSLSPDDLSDSLVIYMNIPESVRVERLSKRKDADDPLRRIATDRLDFDGFTNYNWEIVDSLFSADEVFDRIAAYMITSDLMNAE